MHCILCGFEMDPDEDDDICADCRWDLQHDDPELDADAVERRAAERAACDDAESEAGG